MKEGEAWTRVQVASPDGPLMTALLWVDIAIAALSLLDLICRMGTAPSVSGYVCSAMFGVDLISCFGLLQLLEPCRSFGGFAGGALRRGAERQRLRP